MVEVPRHAARVKKDHFFPVEVTYTKKKKVRGPVVKEVVVRMRRDGEAI